jgi:hypothetical protein
LISARDRGRYDLGLFGVRCTYELITGRDTPSRGLARRLETFAMSRIRFSLFGLAGATAVIALACAALVRAAGWVADLTWAATLLILTLTVLCAMLVAPSRRGFWVGFSLFGWMYVLLAYSPLADRPNVPSLQPLLRQAAEAMPQAKRSSAVAKDASTYTEYLLDAQKLIGAEAALSQRQSPQAVDAGWEYVALAQLVGDTRFIESFVRISQALITLLLALVGGIAGHFIRQRSLSSHSTPAVAS